MQTVYTLANLHYQTPVSLTIGAFDGVHLGHRHLIGSAVQSATAHGLQSAVLTFDPHPDLVMRPERGRLYLTTLAERLELIAALGVDLTIVQTFDRTLASLTAEEYVAQLTSAVPLRELHIGWDFALGKGRAGNAALLSTIGETHGYSVTRVAPLEIGGGPVSSTRIRTLLAAGEVRAIPALLGRPFGVRGTVAHGDQRGRTIGYPTANLAVAEERAIPADGVYVCSVSGAGLSDQGAVTNIGMRPTVGGLQRTLEAHIFDFNGDLYGQELTLSFHERLRAEQRFDGLPALIAQISRDADAARAWLAAHR